MSQIPYRANLSAAIFPMTIARSGRSVIVPGADQNFNRSIDSPDDSNRDAGIPQIIYGENILPTADGFQSVGYISGGSAGPAGSGFSWTPVKLNIPNSGRKYILALIGLGEVKLTYDGITYLTATIVGTPPSGPLNYVSTATVRGVCYLHVGPRIYTVTGIGTPVVTEVTSSFTPVGILTNLINICGAFNYLVLLKSDGTVNWSSTTTPTDFVPSLVSGAGSGALTGNSGAAQALKANPSGFYVYCVGNVINAFYTGNARYPWKFIPVADSEGVLVDRNIAGDPTDSVNFTISNSGTVMQVSPQTASPIAQEISEIVSRLKYRDVFNYTSNEFSVVTAGATPLASSITYLMNRYIILSQENVGYVYDLEFKRYGKFNVDHNYVIDLEPLESFGTRTLAFINLETGTTNLLNTNVNDPNANMKGVMLLGKFEYVRSRFIVIDEVSVECSQLGSLVPASQHNFGVYAIPSLDGKTFQPAQSLYKVTTDYTSGNVTYNSSAEGKNICLLVKGAFDLCSVEMLLHLGGSV